MACSCCLGHPLKVRDNIGMKGGVMRVDESESEWWIMRVEGKGWVMSVEG